MHGAPCGRIRVRGYRCIHLNGGLQMPSLRA